MSSASVGFVLLKPRDPPRFRPELFLALCLLSRARATDIRCSASLRHSPHHSPRRNPQATRGGHKGTRNASVHLIPSGIIPPPGCAASRYPTGAHSARFSTLAACWSAGSPHRPPAPRLRHSNSRSMTTRDSASPVQPLAQIFAEKLETVQTQRHKSFSPWSILSPQEQFNTPVDRDFEFYAAELLRTASAEISRLTGPDLHDEDSLRHAIVVAYDVFQQVANVKNSPVRRFLIHKWSVVVLRLLDGHVAAQIAAGVPRIFSSWSLLVEALLGLPVAELPYPATKALLLVLLCQRDYAEIASFAVRVLAELPAANGTYTAILRVISRNLQLPCTLLQPLEASAELPARRAVLLLWLFIVGRCHGSVRLDVDSNRGGEALALREIVAQLEPSDFAAVASLLQEPLGIPGAPESLGISIADFYASVMSQLVAAGHTDRTLELWPQVPVQFRRTEHLTAIIAALTRSRHVSEAIQFYNMYPPLRSMQQLRIIVQLSLQHRDYDGAQAGVRRLVLAVKHSPARRFSSEEQREVLRMLRALAGAMQSDVLDSLFAALESSRFPLTEEIVKVMMEHALARGEYEKVQAWFERLPQLGFQPDVTTSVLVFLRLRQAVGDFDGVLSLYRKLRGKARRAVTVETVTVVLAACADKREAAVAWDVWNEAFGAGGPLVPDRVAYNALANVYLRAGHTERLAELLQTMRGAGVEPQLDTYTTFLKAANQSRDWATGQRILVVVEAAQFRPNRQWMAQVLEFLCGQDRVEDAEAKLQTLVAEGATVPAADEHFCVLMWHYNRLQKYNRTIAVFDMLNQHLPSASFRALGLVIRAYTHLLLEDGKDLAWVGQLVHEILAADHEPDRGSPHSPKTLPSPDVVSTFLRPAAGKGDPGLLRGLLEQYMQKTQQNVADSISLLKTTLLMESAAGNHRAVESIWSDLYWKVRSKSLKQALGAEEGTEIPRRFRGEFYSTFGAKLRQLQADKRPEEALELLETLENDGFRVTNEQLNEVVQLGLRSLGTIHRALEIAEKRLMSGYIFISCQRRDRRKNRSMSRRSSKRKNDEIKYPLFYLTDHSLGVVTTAMNGFIRHNLDSNPDRSIKSIVEELYEKYPLLCDAVDRFKFSRGKETLFVSIPGSWAYRRNEAVEFVEGPWEEE